MTRGDEKDENKRWKRGGNDGDTWVVGWLGSRVI